MGTVTNFPFGVSSFGVVLPSSAGFPVSIPRQNGQTWFVDTLTGSDGNTGGDSSDAFKTIQRAIDMAGNGTGDTVYIAPGTYAENLIVNKDDLAMVAMIVGGNSKRVAVAPAAGIALDVQDALRFCAFNIRFVGTGDVGVQTSSDGAYWSKCDFTSDTTHGCQLYGRYDDSHTSSGAIFAGCLFRECGGAGMHLKAGTGGAVGLYATNVIVTGCQFYLNTDDDINDDAPGTALAAFSQWDINNSHFMTVDKVTYLDLNGTTGGTECQVSDNMFSITVNTNYAVQFQMPAASVGGFVGNFSSIGVIDGHAL